MLSHDCAFALVFNGEIYDYREVRAELVGLGARFRTQGDAEVILEAYRQWGTDCPSHLNGMFAFAIWDRNRKILFCARDRFGEKPFLYVHKPGFFAFASEFRALLALEGVDASIDETRLARFIAVPADGLDRDEETLFPAVHQIPPGRTAILDLAEWTWKTAPYWQGAADSSAGALNIAQSAERFRHLLEDSIRLRLRSDVRLGSCLSGGLDSGSIACLVRRQLGKEAPYHVFSGRFPGSPADEGPYIDAIAHDIEPIRHDICLSAEGLATDFEDFFWANELPVDSASQYAQFSVFRAARQEGVTVLLDGQGADEILGGYEQYFMPYLAEDARRQDYALISARYPGVLQGATAWRGRLPLPLRRSLARSMGRGSDIAFGLRADLATSLAASTRAPPTTLHDALRRDALDGFLGTLLRYGDRNSMAHSVEVRLPFCDHRLFELAQGLSSAHLMGDAQTKRVLREAMRGILPEEVRTRWRKQGFLPPHENWMSGALLPLLEDYVRDPSFGTSMLWEPSWWRKAMLRFQRGDTTLAKPLWKVLSVEGWRRHYLSKVRKARRWAPIQ